MNILQTLDRGLLALEAIARKTSGLTVGELAESLDVHRAIAYRIVATLESRSLVTRSPDGQIRLGPGLAWLASRFEPQLRAVAAPFLDDLANETSATAFLTIAEGNDCVVIMVAEPETTVLRVGYRIGSRHPLTCGAAGIAILSGRPASADDSDLVKQARKEGIIMTRGQIQKGAVGVASPLLSGNGDKIHFEASIGVVAMEDLDIDLSTKAVLRYAEKISTMISRQDRS
ncbi:IclR family transcriptional regulator [Emcibacter nanhaiensis]|uniref:Helix-turn-helix domain-containing protein n=1 Tax=Emcibacter nanhaiensis TaxID=1505037 RepID=A0A501PH96_9PROT|nr:helix-turn-helix domain-containing protein [Emcibacter nanhaiensis]TPD59843.1 helix-turn-helix domain-containing protein [Emcibacter nanhaiensis]